MHHHICFLLQLADALAVSRSASFRQHTGTSRLLGPPKSRLRSELRLKALNGIVNEIDTPNKATVTTATRVKTSALLKKNENGDAPVE